LWFTTELAVLTRAQAKAFYDRFGAKQDKQGFYEDPALDNLVAHADFEHTRSVFEFGCGTGRFAERLLDRHLPQDAVYHGVDLSDTMVALARDRLRRFGDRGAIVQSDGSAATGAAPASVDAFVSNYVLDLLPDDEIRAVFAEAQRVLRPGGRLCVVSGTRGRAGLSRLVSWLWGRVHALRPALVGGCRPLLLTNFLAGSGWRLEHVNVVVAYGVPSEVVVARPED
jgi:ubiquinone/menaquinone biosynthesis C-methylase UbiE